MIVFRYDSTFEGLLTALFDAYGLKRFPDALLPEGAPAPLFALGEHVVATDPAKAERVWRGLEKLLSRRGRNMILHVWLSEAQGSDLLLLRYLRKLFDTRGAAATDFTDPEVMDARRLARNVAREAEHLRQFVRLQRMADQSYFAPVSPPCNALPAAVDYFADRFADQRWLIYDLRRGYGYHHDAGRVREVSFPPGEGPVANPDPGILHADEKFFQELWRTYFRALAIAERTNERLQRQHMPRRFWKYLPEME